MSQDAYDVAVIIVGLNARDYVRQCVASLGKAAWRSCTHQAIYVDNASTDGTPDMLRRDFPHVQVIVNASNVGFCKAANQGASAANCRYYYFLNDDTVLLDDAVAVLVEAMDADARIGTIGSRLLNPDLSEQWSGRRFPRLINGLFGRRSLLGKLFPNAPPLRAYLYKDQLQAGRLFDVEWVSAAGQIVRANAFDEVGGFAEDYYYWHEAVFCARLSRRQWKVMLHPGSKVIHFEGKGSGPRPYRVRRWHVLGFHRGAYRCYCEYHALGRLHPMRWIAAAALWTRALVLLGAARLSSLRQVAK